MSEQLENNKICNAVLEHIIHRSVADKFISKGRSIPKKLIAVLKKDLIDIKNIMRPEGPAGGSRRVDEARLDETVKKMLQQMRNENPDIVKMNKRLIKLEYSEYRNEEKYLGDTKLKDTQTVFTPDGEIGTDIIQEFDQFLRAKRKAVCFSYIHHMDTLTWLDPDAYGDEMKRFRKLIKSGELLIRPENIVERKINNVPWYSLVLQNVEEDSNNVCAGSVKLFGYIVSGFVYWFPNKKNRDNIYSWLIK